MASVYHYCGRGANLVRVIEVLVNNTLDVAVVSLEGIGDHGPVLETSHHDHHLDVLRRHRRHLGPSRSRAVGASGRVLGGRISRRVADSRPSNCHPDEEDEAGENAGRFVATADGEEAGGMM